MELSVCFCPFYPEQCMALHSFFFLSCRWIYIPSTKCLRIRRTYNMYCVVDLYCNSTSKAKTQNLYYDWRLEVNRYCHSVLHECGTTIAYFIYKIFIFCSSPFAAVLDCMCALVYYSKQLLSSVKYTKKLNMMISRTRSLNVCVCVRYRCYTINPRGKYIHRKYGYTFLYVLRLSTYTYYYDFFPAKIFSRIFLFFLAFDSLPVT